MAQRAPSVAQIAAGRVGLLKSARVCAYIVQWGLVRDDLGHDPSHDEYSDWWNCSIRTTYREQALFRQAFPGEVDPGRILDETAHAWANRPSRRPSPKSLGAAPFPAAS